MKGENYYLILELQNETPIRVFSKGLSLKEMDTRTTRYKSKEELINRIYELARIPVAKSVVKDVKVMQVTKDEEGKDQIKSRMDPLLEKDKVVIDDPNSILSLFKSRAHNRDYLKEFLSQYYVKSAHLGGISREILRLIREHKPYTKEIGELKEDLLRRIGKSHSELRYLYVNMKRYDEKHLPDDLELENATSKPVESQKQEADVTTRKMNQTLWQYTDEDREIDSLDYLAEHERETLDISDYTGYENISPFDGSKEMSVKKPKGSGKHG